MCHCQWVCPQSNWFYHFTLPSGQGFRDAKGWRALPIRPHIMASYIGACVVLCGTHMGTLGCNKGIVCAIWPNLLSRCSNKSLWIVSQMSDGNDPAFPHWMHRKSHPLPRGSPTLSLSSTPQSLLFSGWRTLHRNVTLAKLFHLPSLVSLLFRTISRGQWKKIYFN